MSKDRRQIVEFLWGVALNGCMTHATRFAAIELLIKMGEM